MNLHDLEFGNGFLEMTLNGVSNKRRRNGYVGLHQIYSFCASKDIIKKVEKQSTEWEKICKSEKGLVAIICF